ncbi:MAG: hypothetical protein KJP07_13470 [Desulfatitalea sp.]|nr:hypothetical protein [Desulfatitalea sp.]
MKGLSAKNSKTRICMRILLLPIALGLLFSSPAWANPTGHANAQNNQEEGTQPQPLLAKAKITIHKKSRQNIYTYGRKFAVNKETLIIGIDSKEVSLKKMLVPCDAQVSYRMENGVPTAKRIDIIRVASEAGWQWIAEEPE